MQHNWSRIVLILLGASVLLFAQEQEMRLANKANAALAIEAVVFGIIAFSFLLLAALKRPPTWSNTYVLLTGLVCFLLFTFTQMLSQPYQVDTLATGQYAAELALQGQRPYIDFHQSAALERFGMPEHLATLRTDGSIEPYFNYPAGAFVFIMPFVAAGVADTRIVYILLLTAMMLCIHYYAEPQFKNLVILAFMSNVVIIRFASGGLPEPLWALPLLLAWIWRENSWRSAIAFGLATSIKQLAWFFAPFYFIMSIKEFGLRSSVKRACVVVAIFFSINAPFIAQGPSFWLRGVLGPVMEPLVPMGAGPISLAISNVLPLWPSTVYLALELAVLAVGLAWYYWRYDEAKDAAMILATLPLWFGWRSLLSYVYLSGILLLGVMLAERSKSMLPKSHRIVANGKTRVALSSAE